MEVDRTRFQKACVILLLYDLGECSLTSTVLENVRGIQTAYIRKQNFGHHNMEFFDEICAALDLGD